MSEVEHEQDYVDPEEFESYDDKDAALVELLEVDDYVWGEELLGGDDDGSESEWLYSE